MSNTDQMLVAGILENNPDIEVLELYDLKLADFSVVKRLTKLRSLQLSCCEVVGSQNYLDLAGMELEVLEVDWDSAVLAVRNLTLVKAKKLGFLGLKGLCDTTTMMECTKN